MRVILGATGWENEHWVGSYYDNDLPEDWRLTFYTRDFKTLLVPKEYWSGLSLEELEEISGDVEKDYPIFFEEPENAGEMDQSVKKMIPNWVEFENPEWQKIESHYILKLGNISANGNLGNDVAVIKASASEPQSDTVIRDILQTIKQEYKDCSIVYVFFEDALLDIDTLNTGRTLQKILGILY